MKQNDNAAIKVLATEMHRLGGIVFARYVASQNKEVNETVNAYEFLGDLMDGKLKKDDADILEPYLKPLYEVNEALNVLSKHFKKGSK